MNQMDEETHSHREIWELIPWVVNGRASEAERVRVERHVSGCTTCRQELAFQRRVSDVVASETGTGDDARAGFARLWTRIDAPEPATPAWQAHAPRALSPLVRGLIAAVIVEAIGLSVLGVALLKEVPLPAPYRTLSAGTESGSSATIRVVLAPTLTIGELQALLDHSQLQVVSGPTPAGVYSLAPRSQHDATTNAGIAARLRAQPGVRFAEPIGGAPESR